MRQVPACVGNEPHGEWPALKTAPGFTWREITDAKSISSLFTFIAIEDETIVSIVYDHALLAHADCTSKVMEWTSTLSCSRLNNRKCN